MEEIARILAQNANFSLASSSSSQSTMAMASGSSRGSRKISTTPSSALNNSRAPAPAVHHPTNAPGSDLRPRRNHQLHRGCRRRLGIKGRRLVTRTHTVSNSEIHDAHGSSKPTRKLVGGGTGGQRGVSCVQMGAATVASSRRLAAALWHLHPAEFVGVERNNRVGFPVFTPTRSDSPFSLRPSTDLFSILISTFHRVPSKGLPMESPKIAF